MDGFCLNKRELKIRATIKPENCTITTDGPEGRLVNPEASKPINAQIPPRIADVKI